MKLTPCPFCGKSIPARMTTCPYCHRDEMGAPVVMDSKISPATAAEMTPAQLEPELRDLSKEDPYVQEQAIGRLAQYGLRATMALNRLLVEPKRSGRAAIAKALGHIADVRSVGALTQAVKQGDDALRMAALWALAQFRDADVLPILLSEAENSHPVTQHYLTYVIGNFHDPRVIPVLSRLALHGSPEVVYQAAYALAEWNEPLAIATLKRTARRRDPVLRAMALSSLKGLGVRAPWEWRTQGLWAGVFVSVVLFAGGLFWFYR